MTLLSISIAERFRGNVRSSGLISFCGLTHRRTLQFGLVTVTIGFGVSIRKVSAFFFSQCILKYSFYVCVCVSENYNKIQR